MIIMDDKPPKSKIFLLIALDLILFILAIYLYYSIKPFNITRKIVGTVKNTYNRLFGKSLCPDCNIILVSLDTLSANHLPCYGYNRDTSPNLCKFGKENILFKNAYSNANFTFPSHVSIFTGLLPSKHKVNVPTLDQLDPKIPFLPQILKENGYETYFNMITNDPHLPIDEVYNRGIDQIYNENFHEDLWEKGLQKFKENYEKGKKTFLFLHTYEVHDPYLIDSDKPVFTTKMFNTFPMNKDKFETCSKDFISFLKNSLKSDLTVPSWNNVDPYWLGKERIFYQSLLDKLLVTTNVTDYCIKNRFELYPYWSRYFYNLKNIDTLEKVEFIKALYDQKIIELDGLLAPLINLIKQDGIQQDTILIIMADHGEEFLEHGEIQHITLYDSNVRIPLIMYIPGIKNKNVNKISQSIDVVPTILDLVGIKHNYLFQGKTLAKDIVQEIGSKEYIVAEKISSGLKTIRDEKYKLFLKKSGNQFEPYLLFDIQNDPNEQQNVIFTHGDIVDNLKKQMDEILNF